MRKVYYIVIIAVFFLCGYIFGRCSSDHGKESPPKPETGVITADNLRPVEIIEPDEMLFVDPSSAKVGNKTPENGNITPGNGNKTAKPVLIAPEVRPIKFGDDSLKLAIATVRDWNLARTYSRTLFDNKQAGKFTYTAVVQFNTLARLEYDYQPATVAVKRERVRPYLRGYVDTRGTYGASVGALYKWFGADIGAVRYGPERYAASIGVMVIF